MRKTNERYQYETITTVEISEKYLTEGVKCDTGRRKSIKLRKCRSKSKINN